MYSPIEREIMALPARTGGLGIPNPVLTAEPSFLDSMKITEELSSLIKEQKWECPKEETMKKAKHEVVKHKRESEKKNLVSIKDKIKTEVRDSKKKPQLLTALEMATLKGASSWLTALPLQDQNFALNKAEFRDALALRYGWRSKNLPQRCACGAVNSISHCLDCKLGGYVTMRHNQTRDTFANLLRKAGCKGVETEQQLLPDDGELDQAEKGDEARMDVTAIGFWGTWQRAFFDVRVFDPFAPSYANRTLSSLFKQQEKEKK